MQRRRNATRVSEQAFAYLLLAPAFLLAIAVVGYPILNTVVTAFSKTNAVGQLSGWTGFANFHQIFADPIFLAALWRTALWTFWVVGLTTVVSMLLALILYEDLRGRRVFQLILLIPWATSVTMTTIAWMWTINGQVGLISNTLQVWGWIQEPLGFLARGPSALAVAIGIGIVVSIPFTTSVLVSGLNSIPDEILEAGLLDGARGWMRFRHLIMPMLGPFLTITLVINLINVFNSFPIIWTLTQGGPAHGTEVVVTYLYFTAFRFNEFGQAAAMSLITFAILLVLSIAFSVQTMRTRLS
ncbi:MAG TPA: sugar ABC transporter permease [Trueperaceae bacterium]|nr:sugar ABC transporter permease [Trueperaceae bacterium]